VNFSVTKGITQDFVIAKSSFDLSSDHSPVLVTLSTQAINQEKQLNICNGHTGWNDFKHLNEKLTLNVLLKTEEETKAAVKFLNDTIPWAGWMSGTQCHNIKTHSRLTNALS
jgi:hypothetical protein